MSKLFIIPTPIGNLDDITDRVRQVINECALLFVEDTRHTGKLLQHLNVKKKMMSYHKFNEHQMVEQCIHLIESNEAVGLISDAGTPSISDPGYLITRACLDAGIEIEALPGPTAFVPALVLSGLPTERFVFEGFLPVKKGRKTRLEMLESEERTMIFYESPYRIGKTLNSFCEHFGGDRRASVSRELTKKFEETRRGSLTELAAHFNEANNKGEFVIVVEGKKS